MSRAELLEKLTDKTYRDAFIAEEIEVGIPMQIREMRECRGWKQGELAEKIGTKQPRIPVMEKPGYGNFSLNTLKKLASVFDVALIVSFVPYSEMIDFSESLGLRRLRIPGFCDEYAKLANRYNRGKSVVTTDSQCVFDFSVTTDAASGFSKIDTAIAIDLTVVEMGGAIVSNLYQVTNWQGGDYVRS